MTMLEGDAEVTDRDGLRSFIGFEAVLHSRMEQLYDEEYRESGKNTPFVMPVGLLLLVDQANGGDVAAHELRARFRLLHHESQNIIDFYFLGWERSRNSRRGVDDIRFNLESFESCRKILKQAGIDKFGGNADLILVDAHYTSQGVTLKFQEGIYLNLSGSVANSTIPSVGEFLQSLIRATEEVRASRADAAAEGFVFSISDKLGLAPLRNRSCNSFSKSGEKLSAQRHLKLLLFVV